MLNDCARSAREFSLWSMRPLGRSKFRLRMHGLSPSCISPSHPSRTSILCMVHAIHSSLYMQFIPSWRSETPSCVHVAIASILWATVGYSESAAETLPMHTFRLHPRQRQIYPPCLICRESLHLRRVVEFWAECCRNHANRSDIVPSSAEG